MKKITFKKMTLNKLLLGAAVVASLLLGLYHRGQREMGAEEGGAARQVGERVPYIKALYGPLTYDPAQMNEVGALVFSELAYEGLLRFSDGYSVEAGIAKSWETSKDGKIMTFTLHEEARFHNGALVTANDVVVSLSRVVAPESKVYKYYDMVLGAEEHHRGEKGVVAGMRALDSRTVVIELKDSFPPMLYILAGGTAKIFPASLVGKKDFFRHPIGAGPFRVSKIQEDRIVLDRFESYHNVRPKIKHLILRISDQKTAIEEAKQGKMHDLAIWPLSGREDIFQQGQSISMPLADTWIVGFNARIAPLDNLEVRRALKKSIDTESFRKKISPRSTRAYGYMPPGFPGHVKGEGAHGGGKASASISIPKHSMITITIPKELNLAEDMARLLEEDLRAKGWKMETELMPWTEMMRRYGEKTLQSFLFSMNVDYPDSEFLLNNFASNNPDNFSGLQDEQVDAWLAEARRLQDRVERSKIYQKIAERINDLALSVSLFHTRFNYWMHECVRNFKPSLLAVAYIDYRRVSLDGDCLVKRGARRGEKKGEEGR